MLIYLSLNVLYIYGINPEEMKGVISVGGLVMGFQITEGQSNCAKTGRLPICPDYLCNNRNTYPNFGFSGKAYRVVNSCIDRYRWHPGLLYFQKNP